MAERVRRLVLRYHIAAARQSQQFQFPKHRVDGTFAINHDKEVQTSQRDNPARETRRTETPAVRGYRDHDEARVLRAAR